MPAAAAAVFGSLASSMIGASATKKASNATSRAAEAQIDESQRQFDLVRGDTGPYREVGQGALFQLAGVSGIPGFEGGARRLLPSEQEELASLVGIQEASQRPASLDTQALIDAYRQKALGGAYVRNDGDIPAPISGSPEQVAAHIQTLDPELYRSFARPAPQFTDEQRQRLQYLQGISGGTGSVDGRTPQNILESIPGYQFRLSESEKALERMQKARGYSLTPRAAKEVGRYVSDYASGEYGNYLERLFRLSGLGGNAVNTSASAGANTASQVGSASRFGGAGAANAALIGGQSMNNAIQGGLSNYITLQQYNNQMSSLNNTPFYGVGASPY